MEAREEKLTEKQVQALTVLEVEWGKELSAREFAHGMWPDSPAWKHVRNTGNGACAGKGMWLSGGSYLRKLQKKGLVYSTVVRDTTCWRISQKGRRLLRIHREELTTQKTE